MPLAVDAGAVEFAQKALEVADHAYVMERGRIAVSGTPLELQRDEPMPGGRRLVAGQVERTACEALLDADGAFSRAKCGCSHHRRLGLRAGPCRHLLALHLTVRTP